VAPFLEHIIIYMIYIVKKTKIKHLVEEMEDGQEADREKILLYA
jgi:hypothetical protein